MLTENPEFGVVFRCKGPGMRAHLMMTAQGGWSLTMPIRTPFASAGLIALAMSMWPCIAGAQPFTFAKIVDSNTVMPDAPGGLQFRASLAFTAAISGQRVSFVGANGNGDWSGIYEWNAGVLVRVADRNTPVPQGTGTFSGFGVPSSSGDHIVFSGGNQTIRGLHERKAGVLTRVADESMNAPNGGKYSGLGSPAVEGNSIVAYGQHLVGAELKPSLYRWDSGIVSTVADTGTAVPGGTSTFTVFDRVRLSQGAVSFNAVDSANKAGIYRRDGSGLNVLVDTNTDGPTGMGKFTSIGDFGVNGDNVILRGATQVGNPVTGGIFTRINGQMTKLLSTGDPAPGGGSITSPQYLSIDGGVAVFYDNNRQAVYTNFGGTLQMVVGSGTVIDGKTVSKVFFGPDGREGNRLALDVQFTDHIPFSNQFDEAVYVVTLPAPASALGMLGACGFAGLRRRR